LLVEDLEARIEEEDLSRERSGEVIFSVRVGLLWNAKRGSDQIVARQQRNEGGKSEIDSRRQPRSRLPSTSTPLQEVAHERALSTLIDTLLRLLMPNTPSLGSSHRSRRRSRTSRNGRRLRTERGDVRLGGSSFGFAGESFGRGRSGRRDGGGLEGGGLESEVSKGREGHETKRRGREGRERTSLAPASGSSAM